MHFGKPCACPDCRVPRMRWSPAAGAASAARSPPRWRRPARRSRCSAATARRWMRRLPPAPRISPTSPMSPIRPPSAPRLPKPPARQPIDILIANAGIAESAPFAKSDAALFRRMMDVNFMGVVHAVQAVLPSMKERPYGRIVAVASTAGLKGYAYVSAYSAAKHAVVGLVRSLALELATTRRHRQCGVSRFHRYRSARRQHRQHHEEDRPQPRAGGGRTCANTIRKAAWSRRRKSPIPCCGCAARAPARSPDRRSRWPAERFEAMRHNDER